MQLSDHDIRDINKFLTEGKPLPDKYRFMLFEDKREVELVWNGKTDEVTNIVLPFQTVETIDEPRSDESVKFASQQYSMFDTRGRQLSGWKNKLIWGDNKLVLSSLKNGPLREEIESNGGIKLIYIDPPFDVGADFSMKIDIGDEEFTKKPSVIEELAYRDTWGKGADSWIAMMYERLCLMRDLLSSEGSIYVHCDYRVSGYLRLLLDEVFGKDNFRNEIIWYYETYQGTVKDYYPRKHDTIFFYTKRDDYKFDLQYTGDPKNSINYKRWEQYIVDGNKIMGSNFPKTDSRFTIRLAKWIKDNNRQPREDDVIFEVKTMAANSVWKDLKPVDPKDLSQKLDYPTQKPDKLLERIIKSSSSEKDIICDFFCGSGTSLATAEKLNRKWIGSDLGKFGIHTTRKRMIDVQRQMKKEGKDYRAFEVLNIGKYERQYYVGLNPTLEQLQQEEQMQKKNSEYVDLILSAYKADKVSGFTTFVGEKMSRLIAIGSINVPVTSSFVNQCIKEASEKGITKIDILGFEFEMNLAPRVQEEAKELGIDLMLKYIPRDVFDKRAIEKGQVEFYDVAYIEVKPHYKGKTVSIELTDFSVFYNQDSGREFEQQLRNNSSKVIIDKGQIVKISKDKDGVISKEVLTKKWSDWIDYWSVDFDYQSKKEVLQVKDENGENQTMWTGDYTFENEWQAFRTKKNRDLELKTNYHEYPEKKRYKVAIKVVDIFGNDTMKVIDVSI
jgi:adenine-specific DNA-methyltransferase